MDPRLPAYPQTHCVLLLLLLLLVILNAISYYGSGFKDPVFYKENQGVKPSSTAIILRTRARDGAANKREFARNVRTPHRTATTMVCCCLLDTTTSEMNTSSSPLYNLQQLQ
jgi:hypothetical protein